MIKRIKESVWETIEDAWKKLRDAQDMEVFNYFITNIIKHNDLIIFENRVCKQ